MTNSIIINNSIHLSCEDNMQLMSRYGDDHFDLAVVDPPYNIAAFQKMSKNSLIDKTGKIGTWNDKVPTNDYFDELFRVSKKQIVWGANNFTMPPTEYFCIWNKHQHVDNFASAEYAWVSPSVKQPAKVFDFSIAKHNASKGPKIHPTMKPVSLYQWIFKTYAKQGYKSLTLI